MGRFKEQILSRMKHKEKVITAERGQNLLKKEKLNLKTKPLSILLNI